MSYPLTTRDLTYAAELPGYVEPQWYKQPVLTALLEGVLEAGQEVEDVTIALQEQFSAATAEGVFLDTIGEIVGEKRGGRSNTTYRIAIQAKVRINKSSGTWDEMITIAQILYNNGDADIRVSDVGGSTGAEGLIEVREDVSALDVDAINRQLQALKPLGVKLQYVYNLSASPATNGLILGATPSGAPDTNANTGLGNPGPNTGGKLAGVYDG
jgi:hypothetical protein